MTNPLLVNDGLPPFSRIEIEDIEPAIDSILADNRAAIAALLAATDDYTWENTLAPLEELADRLSKAWSPVSHLHGVADSEPLRAAYSACLAKISDYWTELGQHEGLYRAYRHVADSASFETLGTAERKIVENALRDFRLSGIELAPEARARFREMKQELTRLQTHFEEQLLDATHGWRKHVTEAKSLEGLPESARALARQAAERAGLEGWLFTLDFPSYMPVLAYADERELRREMYEAYVTRASDQGPNAGRWDNSEIMVGILRLRREMARLLGFDTYAHYSLATKMAKEPRQVLDFLYDLARRSRPVAEREFDTLRDYAAAEHGVQSLEAWDIPYYSEKLRRHAFNISPEELRPYFPVPKVLSGLFSVVQRLYGLHVAPGRPVETWHPDVVFYEIRDDDGELRGLFYLDLYARAHKRGGAWMDECVVRKRTAAGVQTPVAYLTCNFTPPIGEDPSLLTHNEVTTLFHEFGHGLHHMLTRIDRPSVAGINGVAWDAVELPSQFMENWCWERGALDLLSGHYKTGEPIPDTLFERMTAARNFQSGLQMLRQIELALFDFKLHMADALDMPSLVQAVLDGVRGEVAVIRPPAFNRFQHSFSHIFAGGYAAGYYSYKWAEVLSADAYAKFEEEGVFNRDTGRRFLETILEQGGSRDAMDLYVEFRGREPSIEPLLRHAGIAA